MHSDLILTAVVWFNIAVLVFGCMMFFDRLSKPTAGVQLEVILPTDEIRPVVAANDDRREPLLNFNFRAADAI